MIFVGKEVLAEPLDDSTVTKPCHDLCSFRFFVDGHRLMREIGGPWRISDVQTLNQNTASFSDKYGISLFTSATVFDTVEKEGQKDPSPTSGQAMGRGKGLSGQEGG